MEHVSEYMQKPVVIIEQDQNIASLIGKLSSSDHPAAIVTSGGSYQGMLDVFSLLKSRMDIVTTKVSSVMTSAPTLVAQDTLVRAGKLFSQTPLRALPVVHDSEVVGILYQQDVQQALDISATTPPATIDTQATLGELIHVLRDNKEYVVSVVEQDVEVGVILLSALLSRYYAQHQTRDQGMRPNQQTKAFTAENSSILDLPIESLIVDANQEIQRLYVTNNQLQEALSDVEDREMSFVGLDKLRQAQKESVIDLFSRLYDKLLVHDRYSLRVHLKMHHKTGTQQKMSIHLRADTVHGDQFEASADEWSLEEAARSAMDKLEWQLRKNAEK